MRFGGERWLYLALLLEFQAGVDRAMAVRMLTYGGLLWCCCRGGCEERLREADLHQTARVGQSCRQLRVDQ